MDIKIYDRNVSIAKLIGANKIYIEKEIPHISSLMTEDLNAIVSHSEILIIGNGSPEFETVLNKDFEGKIVYDLIRISKDIQNISTSYEGICW